MLPVVGAFSPYFMPGGLAGDGVGVGAFPFDCFVALPNVSHSVPGNGFAPEGASAEEPFRQGDAGAGRAFDGRSSHDDRQEETNKEQYAPFVLREHYAHEHCQCHEYREDTAHPDVLLPARLQHNVGTLAEFHWRQCTES